MKRYILILALSAIFAFSFVSCEKEKTEIKVEGVTVSSTDLVLDVGEKFLLTANLIPENADNQNVKWSSLDDKIATVDDDGLVTAVSVGDTKIVVLTEDGAYTAESAIKVTGQVDDKLEKILLDKNKLELFIGESAVISATTEPAGMETTLEWKTSNADIASVTDDGTVTGISAGVCVLTVSSEDGKVSANCAITVKQNVLDIPDPKFKAFLVGYFDADGDGEISESEAESVEVISCRDLGIKSLEGVQHFPNLSTLFFFNNDVTSVDVSANKKLRQLGGSGNKIKTLDLTENIYLEKLIAEDCELEEIDIRECKSISQLSVSGNNLKSIDLSNNTSLKYLMISRNPLSELSVTNNKMLEELDCSMTDIQILDLSNNKNLLYLSAGNCKLTNIDFTNNPKLKTVDVAFNELSSLDFISCQGVEWIICNDNQITDINITRSSQLEQLKCNNNKLNVLDLSGTFALKRLLCGGNEITELDLSKASMDMTEFECAPMPSLTTITVSKKQTKISSIYPERDDTKIPSQAEIVFVD